MKDTEYNHDDGSETIVELFQRFYRNYYDEDIAALAQQYPKDKSSLYIDAPDLFAYNPDLYDDYLEYPDTVIGNAEEALTRHDLPIEQPLTDATVRLRDTADTIPTSSVSDLHPNDIGSYLGVKGQLARITQANPRMEKAVYVCERCDTAHEIEQKRTEIRPPHECKGCDRQGPFNLDQESSEWSNQRKVKLEEPISERAQARGQSLPVYVEGDLCDVGPGDSTLPDHAGEQATIYGIVRVDESQLSGRNASPETEYWIDARAIEFSTDDAADIDIEAHREAFEAVAEREDAVDLVASSLAPSLHAEAGDDLHTVRRAAAAWLFNAYRLDPDDAGAKRGDIHMCLIGDPGVGKSTLMSYLHDVCPTSEFRTGTGLTEVGLTAAAVQEEFAGQSEWTLQPGILPRANGGHCIIDEVDGVVDENTKAIHDALEGEQMVKADKAGIQADLPTRCALLAGGNPSETRFNRHDPVTDQIDLDPALFDRMDLVFAMQDVVDEERDRTTAGHTLDAWDELARADRGSLDPEDATTTRGAVPKDTIRAWVAYARRNVFPALTNDAKDRLQEFYVDVRDLNDGHENDDAGTIPATVRTLEAGIRLSVAFARLRLSETVDETDADRAIDLTKEVVGLRFDPETGQFDTARTESGQTTSQKNRKQAVVDAIQHLAADREDEAPPIEAVVNYCSSTYSESVVEKDCRNMIRDGDATEPKTGHIRYIGRS